MTDLHDDSFASSEILQQGCLCLLIMSGRVFPLSSFFQYCFLPLYLFHDPGDLGGGPGRGLVGPEFGAPG